MAEGGVVRKEYGEVLSGSRCRMWEWEVPEHTKQRDIRSRH